MNAAARIKALREALMSINSLFFNREEFDLTWADLAIKINDYAEEALLADDIADEAA